MKRAVSIFLVLAGVVLLAGTIRNRDFWRTPEQRGDALARKGKYADAAKQYTDPARIGVAQYRNGDFEAAAKTFARVPGAVGAFDQGNAWLMHGKYDAAIASYDRALSLRPDWNDALDNKAIAVARKAKLEASAKDREQEQTDTGKPDEIAFDQKGDDARGQPVDLARQDVSDEALRATWLRQVRTTPGDFLRAKFAYQAAHAPPKEGGR
jgi:Ca-activated chloride channel family protein